jgi:hypothetical protein
VGTGAGALAAAVVAAVVVQVCACAAGPPPPHEELRFTGPLSEAEDLSAVAVLGDLLVIASDEGSRLQLLRAQGDGITFRAVSEGIPLLPGDEEVDIEGLALDGGVVYALGSHSLKRLRVRPERSRVENRERLATVAPEEARHRIFRLELDPETGLPAGPASSINLRPILERDPILGPFTKIPDKENGISIEGIAVRGSRLFLGFRAPVLRGGFVPVMALRFEDPSSYDLFFVHLDGRGIRSLEAVREGFLLVASYERPRPDAAELFLWDGEDQVPGRDAPPRRPRKVADWPLPAGASLEAIAVVAESEEQYELLLVHDNVAGGAPARLRVAGP